MTTITVSSRRIAGGGVPGGHYVLDDGERRPFIPPTRELHAIPLRTTDVVADIGAYVGTYSVIAARRPVRLVRAFEPTPRTFSVLERNLQSNILATRAAVIGDDRRIVDLYVSSGIGVTNSLVLDRRKPETISVAAFNYLDAVRDATVVKVDIEGGEYDLPIVADAEARPELRGVILDFHPVPGVDWLSLADQIMSGLEAAGFAAIIRPSFKSGWNVGGAWIRDTPDVGVEYEPMTRGRQCCGCGRAIHTEPDRGLCGACWKLWTPKHRAGYRRDWTAYGDFGDA